MSLTKSQVKDLPILKYLNPTQSDEIIGYNEIPSAHFNNMAMENKKESLVEIKKISCLKAEKIEEDLKKTFTDFVEILQVENDPKNYIEGSFKLKFKNLPDTIKSISLYSMNTMVDAGLLQIGAPKESTRKPQEFIKYNLQSNEDFTTNQFDIWPFNALFAVFNVQDECFIRKITIEI